MQNIRTNIDEKLKCKIDIANVSKGEIIQYLCQTIHCEVERGKESDCDLIRECSDWLDELTADEIIITPEELAVKLDKIKSSTRCDYVTYWYSHIFTSTQQAVADKLDESFVNYAEHIEK